MRRALFVLALGAVGFLGAIAARADEEASAPVTDPARVSVHYREVLQKPQFQDSGEVDVDERLRDVLEQWFFNLGKDVNQFKYISRMMQVASMMLVGMVVLCVGGVVYVCVRLYRRRAEYDLDDAVDAPEQKSFRPPEFYEQEIQVAIRSGDWHAAWLAAWRQFLSRLESRQLVEADRTRTNREYLAQLRERALPSPAPALLTALVDAYDRFIYGHRPIAEPDWNLFQRQVGEAGLLLDLDDRNHRPKPAPP